MAAQAHAQPPAQALCALVEHMRTALAADYVVIYKYTSGHYWAVAPPGLWSQGNAPQQQQHGTTGDAAAASAPRAPAPVGRGIAGCVAATGKVAHVSDVKRSPLYDAAVDDIRVPQTSSAVRTALAARAADPGGASSGAVVKAMRGWQQPARAFSADDAAQLQWCAATAAQVRRCPLTLQI